MGKEIKSKKMGLGKKFKSKKWGWGRISRCRELYTPLYAGELDDKEAERCVEVLALPQLVQQRAATTGPLQG